MPYALSRIVPYLSEKGYICLSSIINYPKLAAIPATFFLARSQF